MSLTTPFYKASKEDLHTNLKSTLDWVKEQSSYRQILNLRNLRLYSNSEVQGFGIFSYSKIANTLRQEKLSYNIIYSIIDTLYNKASKAKPLPMFLTDGGNWNSQRKARGLNKWVEGKFNEVEYYSHQAKLIRDSEIFGTGILKIYREGKNIKLDRVLPNEIFVDENESFYGKPRSLHQVKYIHRDVLKELFPKKAKDLNDTKPASEDSFKYIIPTQYSSDMIEVWETWHLPSGEDSGDGRHCIIVENCTLMDEEYTKDYFPFLFLHYDDPVIGFWGSGIAEKLTGVQVEINKVLQFIQKVLHLMAAPKWLVNSVSNIVQQHLNNEIGGVIKYTGDKPEAHTFNNLIGPEVFNHLDRLVNTAYSKIGLSQLSAQSIKPSGLNSGKALRTYNDIESERFAGFYKKLEDLSMMAARQMIDLQDEIFEEFGNVKQKYVNTKKGHTESLDWKKIKLNKDEDYQMSIFPISAFSKTPAARLEESKELADMGLIPQEYLLKILDFPDLQEYYNDVNAAYEDIMATIDKMVYDEYKEDISELYDTPLPYQNLQLGIKKAQSAFLRYRHTNCPPERLELLTRWIDQAQAMLTPPPPPPQPTVPPVANAGTQLPPQAMAGVIEEPQLPPMV